jgi:hypothetical protein
MTENSIPTAEEHMTENLHGRAPAPAPSAVALALFAAAACTLWAATAGNGAAQGLPQAPGTAVMNLTPHPGYFNEPAIAVNPNNPKNLVAAYQTDANAAYSFDAGRTWTLASGTAAKRYLRSGDVAVTFDNQGRAFLCYIAFDKLGTENYWAHNATRNGIFVRRSPDGGETWQTQAATVIAHPTRPGIPFEDKPALFADNTPSPFAGNLYVGWTHFTLNDSEIYFSRSTDGGETWSEPIRISTEQGLPRDDNGAVEGVSGAVSADGTVNVVWQDGRGIVFATSHDGGKTFDPSRRVVPTAPSYFTVQDVWRANGFPQLGLDPRTGRLYVTWSDYRNGDVDVFAASSADGGRTWSDAVRVNNDALHDGCDQFFQWLAVDPVGGAVYVLFYDRRSDPDNLQTTVVLARSTDHGGSFTNYAWTKQPFEAQGDFIGDYNGLAAYDNRVYGIWTEKPPAKGRAAGAPATGTRHHSVVRVGIADFSQ